MNSKYKYIKLGDVLEVQNGFAFDSDLFSGNEGIPLLRIRDLKDGTKTEINYTGDHDEKYIVKNNDLLIGMDGEFRCYRWNGRDALLNQRVCRLTNFDKGIHPLYIFYGINSFLKNIEDNTSYSTVKHISSKQIKDIQFIFPPLQEQIRIAEILSRAEQLIAKRKESIRLLDEYVKSVFLEMFGDPVRNEKGWEWKEIENVCNEIYRYPTFYGFKYVEKGIPVVKIGNILPDGIIDPNIENYSFISSEINKRYPRTILELYDILMAVRGDGSTVKRIGIIKNKSIVGANMSPNLLRLNVNRQVVTPIFLFFLMTSKKGQILLSKYINKTAKKTITASDIKQILIPVPPIEVQKKFSSTVEKVESMKEIHQESLLELECLYGALSQRMFRSK